jgi:hypothetical protein
VELPGRWVEINPSDSLIELELDGGGRVENLPTPGKGECELDNSIRYTGTIEWRPRDEGSVFIEFENGQAILWADTQFMGSLNWDKVILSICGVDTPQSELVVLGGGSLSRFP